MRVGGEIETLGGDQQHGREGGQPGDDLPIQGGSGGHDGLDAVAEGAHGASGQYREKQSYPDDQPAGGADRVQTWQVLKEEDVTVLSPAPGLSSQGQVADEQCRPNQP